MVDHSSLLDCAEKLPHVVLQQQSVKLVCHCLRVTEDQIRDASQLYAAQSVRDITKCTGAGGGCMVCHARIRSILAERPLFAPAQSE